jgi:hypothetical protein
MGTSGWGVIPTPSPRATLDENIVRHELTELERAEMEARRREIYETLYPMARVGVRRRLSVERESATLNADESGDEPLADTVSASGESGALNDDESLDLPPPYTRYAAEHGGESDRTVRQRLRIAEKLYPDVRDYIRGTPLADDQRGLLRLTRLEEPELQLLAARLIVEGGYRAISRKYGVVRDNPHPCRPVNRCRVGGIPRGWRWEDAVAKDAVPDPSRVGGRVPCAGVGGGPGRGAGPPEPRGGVEGCVRG